VVGILVAIAVLAPNAVTTRRSWGWALRERMTVLFPCTESVAEPWNRAPSERSPVRVST